MEGCGETLHASARQLLSRVAADLASGNFLCVNASEFLLRIEQPIIASSKMRSQMIRAGQAASCRVSISFEPLLYGMCSICAARPPLVTCSHPGAHNM
jgi:hypothetical protein